MSDIRATLEGINFSQAEHLPIVAAFSKRIGLVDTVNITVPTEMDVDVGDGYQCKDKRLYLIQIPHIGVEREYPVEQQINFVFKSKDFAGII